jgi:hypothetical protein
MTCDECANRIVDHSDYVFLPDLGYFHHDCVQRCPDGIDWPRSMVSSGDVRFACAGCAKAVGAA